MQNSASATPKIRTPSTPIRLNDNSYPISSPYTGNTPLALPIQPPIFKTDDIDLTTAILEPPIPVGCDIDQLPFMSSELQELLLKSYRGIYKQLKNLNKLNDIIVDMNESVDAYLFGLFQNAWCVHFERTPSAEHWSKLKELEDLKSEAKKLQDLIIAKKEQRRNRDSQRMPPPIPSSSRGSGGFVIGGQANRISNQRPNSRIYKPRMKPISNKISRFRSNTNGLRLGLAQKVETDPIESSIDSNEGDTTEFIKEPIRTTSKLISVPKSFWRAKSKDNWKVKHDRPFR